MKKLSFAAYVFLCASLCATLATGQVTSSRLYGTVKDPQGASVPNAKVVVADSKTGQTFEAQTNERGDWAVVSLSASTYQVTVSAPGFKSSVAQNVALEAGVPAQLNLTLEVGGVTETVVVTGGAEVLQTGTATVNSTLTGRQVNEMPFTSQRNALDLIVTQPGTATPGTPRTSSINGLPKGSLNIMIDGVNVQDALLRSSDGFFADIQPKSDNIEEVTLSTAGSGAESTGQGAAQIRFVTKSGSNAWHGGASWSVRNDYFNSNYYFNTIDKLPRDRIDLNQVGARLGGPIWKNKAFFFVSDEEFRLPQTYRSNTQTVLSTAALNGIFSYVDTIGKTQNINLYQLAAAKNATLASSIRAYPTTADPILASVLGQINTAVNSGQGALTPRQGDLNRNSFTFQAPGQNKRRFFTSRLDFNLTQKHHLEVVGNFQYYNSNPDGVNNILPIYPGSGTVLGQSASGGIWRENSSIVGAVRSTITGNITNELRAGISAFGNTLFRGEIVPALFAPWRGYSLTLNYITNPQNSSSQSRRNTPVRTVTDSVTWSKGSHLLNFGGTLTQINSWQSANNSALIPSVSFALAAGDPVNTGTITSLFTAANFPNSTSTNLTDAGSLYALLTGRVTSFTRSTNLDEKTHQYGAYPLVDRNQQREFALYVQDAYRRTSNLTLNYGVRWDVQLPFTNQNGTYSSVGGLTGLYGVSGVANLFKPGVPTGPVPQFLPVKAGDETYKTRWNQFSPSVGFAYKIPKYDAKVLKWLRGDGDAVFRAGYSIAGVLEGMNVPISIWGSNQGTSQSGNISASTFPTVFGTAGSVSFRDATLPALTPATAPVYPIAVNPGNTVNDFDPNLRQAYVQSWNVSFQRELDRDTVIDIRYVGNHSVGLWRQVNINEANIFENGFLDEFKIAQANLALAQLTSKNSTQFAGLAGQKPLPIITTALGLTSDTTTANQLMQGQAGALASAIASNGARMANLTKAGYPANFFTVNPTTLNGGSFLVTNGGSSTFDSLQVEVRRRMSRGLLMQGSYAWGKSLTNMDASSSSVFNQPSTLRNTGYDKGPSPWDIRHSFKVNAIYELPFGPGRRFGSSLTNPIVRRAIEGWELSAVTRVQSGSPAYLRSGRQTVNAASGQSNTADAGVVLHNITLQQLRDQVGVYKDPSGIIYYLPPALAKNSYAAFEINGQSLFTLDPNAPYIGPPTTAGQFGQRIFLYGPWQQYWNLSVAKKTNLGEKRSVELRAAFLNVGNNANFLMAGAGNDVNTLNLAATTNPTFGQTRSAYRDFSVSGTNDPGGRVIEFTLRFNF